jgi:hypothetical protein
VSEKPKTVGASPVNAERKRDGRFTAGNPGKPKGARHKTTVAMEALLDGDAEAITRKAIELAKDGDLIAIRICMDRLLPPRRDRSVSVDMPKIETAGDGLKAIATILDAVARGNLTPGEAGDVVRVVEAFTRSSETIALEARIAALEQRSEK